MIVAVLGIPLVLFALWMVSGYLPTRNIAMPSYRVIEKKKGYELRAYESFIIAETGQAGSGAAAGPSGFKELFRYISGNNVRGSKLGMTSPVLKSPEGGGEKIPMAAPVIKLTEGEASMIAFVMPPGSMLEDLPLPRNPAVRLRIVPSCTVAAITFSGVATREAIGEKTESLLESLGRDGYRPRSAPRVALYNPPWTPPFMRRNEVQIELD